MSHHQSDSDVPQRTVFFVSDRTAITAETLGHSLLAQFQGSPFRELTIPFIDSPSKAEEIVAQINAASEAEELRPILFSTLADPVIREQMKQANALMLDLFETFLEPLEQTMGVKASTHPWAHRVHDRGGYDNRIDAIDFSLQHDDGAMVKHYDKADIIMVGVSRTGKTPTCLYLAMQFGIRAANYPITEDDLENTQLPGPVAAHRPRLFGLTIDPSRLQNIRQERRRGSRYASLDQCRREIRTVESLFQSHGITFINTTNLSVEEIATRVVASTGLERHSH